MVFSIGVTSCSSERSSNQAVKTSPGHAVDQETVTRNVYENELARTPPMGWNSWNCFHKDINEVQMITTAGYRNENPSILRELYTNRTAEVVHAKSTFSDKTKASYT